jgi:prepilin-type N-terminal cleavage/methylation domain-containing protein
MSKAFTLIELLVVVAIIGVLAAIGLAGYNSYNSLAQRQVAKQNFFTTVKAIETEIAKCKLSGNRATAITFGLPCPFQATDYYQECAAIYLSFKYKVYNPLMPYEANKWIAGSQCPTKVEENIRGGVRSGDSQLDGDVNIVICPRSPYCTSDPVTDGKIKVMWWYDGGKMQNYKIIQTLM